MAKLKSLRYVPSCNLPCRGSPLLFLLLKWLQVRAVPLSSAFLHSKVVLSKEHGPGFWPSSRKVMSADPRATARHFVRSLNILLKFARLYEFAHVRTAAQLETTW